ncbi:hypothetical protein OPU71_16730 [Niveibacterium sp. 24ML]|uniref:hypothetical protein n=1 Tax=Niveibacterium sp. 24ML TaxID=2985512 RepID=UPI00226D44BD|nr:hypothetical protein [Niveibacterium sp. 24ML]MCX9157771.1 hypothetical protein [Niveibacterium sp. 24ML]
MIFQENVLADENDPPFLREADRAREMANDIFKGRNPLSKKTEARYRALWDLICKRGGIDAVLSGGRSRGYYYQLRAALLFHHVEPIATALAILEQKLRGVSPEDIEIAAREVIEAVEVLQRLDPDFARERYKEKSGSLWKEERAKTCGKPLSRRSKKTSIRGLT